MDWILDWRSPGGMPDLTQVSPLLVEQCPTSWHDLHSWFRQALQTNRQLAIAYPPPNLVEPIQVWYQLVGIAKYLSRTGSTATYEQLQEKLGTGELPLRLGLQALAIVGFEVTDFDQTIEVTRNAEQAGSDAEISLAFERFSAAIQEEQFHRQYFSQVP